MYEEIKKLAEEGKTRQEAADLLNISYQALCYRARQANIKFKHGGKDKPHNKGTTGPRVDLSGQVFEASNLEVLERDLNPPFRSHETAYKCKCILCGDIKTYRRSNIVNGPGCYKCSGVKAGRGYREWNVGDRYGYLTIVGPGQKQQYVKCQCDCGTIKDIKLGHLKGQGHSYTISCGCKQESAGELKIRQLLDDNNIFYQSQYKIPDLSAFMSFDFALFDEQGELSKLIEYDGEQHFHPIDIFGGEEKFEEQQERDKRKNQYCEEHGIKLLRIPYTDYDKITLDLLLS